MGYNRRCPGYSRYRQGEPGRDDGPVEMWLGVQPDVIEGHEKL